MRSQIDTSIFEGSGSISDAGGKINRRGIFKWQGKIKIPIILKKMLTNLDKHETEQSHFIQPKM